MYQVQNPGNTMHYLSILDKCTQIIRQDRIWLRNLLKANNQDVFLLFKGLPKVPNMKDLQIRLRKYINRTKQNEKQQQLLRFKQNMHLPQFIEVASQKRSDPYQQNKSQTKPRTPLNQNQINTDKSSFVAKWNNYSHHNHSNNLMQNRSQVSQASQLSQQSKSLRKQWINNYKPHTFNKSLNGELANKLSSKNNKSTSNFKKMQQTSNFSREKYPFRNNNENQQSMQGYNFNARSSSNSLKQLQNKIYGQLKQFQNNKYKKQSEYKKQTEYLNRTHSQQLMQKKIKDQKPILNFPQTQKSIDFSKQNIDQILKFKLGNCNFEDYHKDYNKDYNKEYNKDYNRDYKKQSSEDEQHYQRSLKQKNSSSKKFYNDGYFPPIQQQTERDSQSQRYPQEPLRFGFNSKQQIEDRHKFTFSSFAKASPNQSKAYLNSMESSLANVEYEKKQKVAQFFQNQKYQGNEERISINNKQNFNRFDQFSNINYQDSIPQKNIPLSLYQSAQKKNDFKEQYIESDLHQSIMKSIKKSRQQFPNQVYFSNGFNNENIGVDLFSSNKSYEDADTDNKELKIIQNSQKISSFQTNEDNYKTHQDSIFTSPELLNECRNFLKKTQQINFQNSGLSNYNSSFRNSKYQSPSNSQPNTIKDTFLRTNMLQFPQPITITESITKDFYQKDGQSRLNQLFESKQSSINKANNQFSNNYQSKQSSYNKEINPLQFQMYSKPSFFNLNSIQKISSNKNQLFGSQVKKQTEPMRQIINFGSNFKQEQIIKTHSRATSSVKKHSEIQEAIFNPNNRLQNQILRVTPALNRQDQVKYQISNFDNSDRVNKNIIQTTSLKIWDLIDLEEIVDKFLQANQGNIEVESTWLKHTVENTYIFPQQIGECLKNILKKFIMVSDTYNFIQIADELQKQYRNNPNYLPMTGPPAFVYNILDMQHKGYIQRKDIVDFTTQLQQAGVQDVEQIRTDLFQVFELADFMSISQISYVNLYIIKNQDCFDQLWDQIKQYEFQFENEQ